MKSVLILFFVLLLTISVVTDVKVYLYNGHEFHNKVKRTKPEPRDSFTFGYHRNETLSMQIYLSFNNNVYMSTDLYIQYPPGVIDSLVKLPPKVSSPGKQYYEIRRLLRDSEIVIELESNTTTGVFTRNQIVRAVDVTGLPNGPNEFPYNDICVKQPWCVIEVDLFDYEKTESAAFTNNMILYALPVTVMGLIIILLVIYLILKKYCHRNLFGQKISKQEDTMELNTYVSTNEILYADLSFASGDSQPPRYSDEASPYAHIIGVLNPQ